MFEAPRDIEGLRLYRLTGSGCLDIGPDGIGASGTAVDRPVPFNGRFAGVAVIAGGAVLALATDRVGQVMPVATVSGLLLYLWHAWKEAEKTLLRWTVPWSRAEHLMQIPQHPDRFAVLCAPDPEHPETLYFTPEDGPEALLAAIREYAPPSFTIETEAAAQAADDEANAPPIDEDAEDDSPWAPRV